MNKSDVSSGKMAPIFRIFFLIFFEKDTYKQNMIEMFLSVLTIM